MNIEPIAYFRSSFPTKFGIPRQSGIVDELSGSIVFVPQYRNADALRGIEGFDYLWLVWEFSAIGGASDKWHPTVRPPLLGGNRSVGVFATRSPFRPNRLGLSSVRIESVDYGSPDAPVIHVRGADLMDGTPIYDIKPYIPYTDAHPSARSGFVDTNEWQMLTVDMPPHLAVCVPARLLPALMKVLALDPRPQYHNDENKLYGLSFGGMNVRFRVCGTTLHVVEID